MKGKWTPGVAFGAMLLAFGPALLLRLRVQDSGGLIITPAWERRVLALAILTALIPAAALIVAAVRRTLRLWVVMPLVVLVVLGVVGGGALMTALTKNFIFPDHHLRTLTTDRGELHLYEGGLFGCRVRVYAAEPHAVFAELVAEENVDCAKLDAVTARWSADHVELEHGGVPETPSLFLGPH